jgi:hypothetical protein
VHEVACVGEDVLFFLGDSRIDGVAMISISCEVVLFFLVGEADGLSTSSDHDKDRFLQGELRRFLSAFTGEPAILTGDDTLLDLVGDCGPTVSATFFVGEFSNDLVTLIGEDGTARSLVGFGELGRATSFFRGDVCDRVILTGELGQGDSTAVVSSDVAPLQLAVSGTGSFFIVTVGMQRGCCAAAFSGLVSSLTGSASLTGSTKQISDSD